MLGQLVPCGGGTPIPLPQPSIMVGRSHNCDVTIPNRFVSSRHCELKFVEGYWSIQDCDSANGIAVNGRRCKDARLLPHDIISIAKRRFSISYRRPQADLPADETPHNAVAETDRLRDLPQPSLRSSPSNLGQLIPCGGGDTIVLWKTPLIVGRRSRCDIQLKFAIVSSRHCRLEFQDDYWFVYDLNSTNGIRVNDVACSSSCLLPNAVLGIGGMRYQLVYSPPVDSIPPIDDLLSKGLLERAGLAQSLDANALDWARDEEPLRKKWTLTDDD